MTAGLVWDLASAFDVVPTPPNDRLAALLRDWWTIPRRFGCRAAKGSAASWFVVAPDLRIWCARCAADRLEVERRCLYCGTDIPDGEAPLLAHEMHGVAVIGRAHQTCHDNEGSATT